MDRLLIHYLPDAVRAFQEYQGITTGEQPEFELLWDLVDEILKNQFILTAEEIGLSRWENILHIKAKETDTYEIRRLRILSILWKRIPYTFSWLQDWMRQICGPEGHTETVIDYTLSIVLDGNILENASELMQIVLEQLAYIVPVNLVIELMRIWQTTGILHVGAFMSYKQVLEVWPDSISVLKTSDENQITGLSSMKHQMEIYPDSVSRLEQSEKEKTAGFSGIGEKIEVYPE